MNQTKNHPVPCLVYATEMEAEPAIQAIQAKPVRYHNCLFVGHTPGSGRKLLMLITGMGLKVAYAAMRGLFITQSISKVINPGIAGSLHAHFQIGELCGIDSVNIEGTSDADFQDLNKVALHPFPDLPLRRLVSVHAPVFDHERRTALATDADLVDMEGAAVAWACHQQRVPCQMLKGVSDYAGTGERTMLHENLPEVSQALADELFRREAVLDG